MLPEKPLPEGVQSFCRLLNATGTFFLSEYSTAFALLQTSSSSPFLEQLFEQSGCKEYLRQYSAEHPGPLILWSEWGLLWLADWAGEADARRVYVIGPINSVETVLSDRQELFKGMNLPVEWEIELDKLAESLPMMSFISLFPYTQMLHYALTGEKIPRRQIAMQQGPPGKPKNHPPSRRDRHRVYSQEQAVLAHIRNGELNYQADWNRMVSQASGVRIFSDGMLQRGKVSVITFIGLCSRAAIDGGMTPERAFRKGDRYIQNALACHTVGDLRQLNASMYDDFVRSIHALRQNPRRSPAIHTCCEYLEEHLEENVTADQLAALVGYTKYYLTRKFKEETGVSVSQYLKFARIERAKQLLAFTDQTIQEIGESLNFCSTSYFTKIFKSIVGLPPAEYRVQYTLCP